MNDLQMKLEAQKEVNQWNLNVWQKIVKDDGKNVHSRINISARGSIYIQEKRALLNNVHSCTREKCTHLNKYFS